MCMCVSRAVLACTQATQCPDSQCSKDVINQIESRILVTVAAKGTSDQNISVSRGALRAVNSQLRALHISAQNPPAVHMDGFRAVAQPVPVVSCDIFSSALDFEAPRYALDLPLSTELLLNPFRIEQALYDQCAFFAQLECRLQGATVAQISLSRAGFQCAVECQRCIVNVTTTHGLLPAQWQAVVEAQRKVQAQIQALEQRRTLLELQLRGAVATSRHYAQLLQQDRQSIEELAAYQCASQACLPRSAAADNRLVCPHGVPILTVLRPNSSKHRL